MTERFGVVTEKGTFLFVNDVIPESTEKWTSRAANSIFSRVANIWRYIFDDKHYSLFLARKYARIFVFGHYLFLEACSFPPASLPENCLQVETDNVHAQISVCIFALNGDYCLFYSLLLIWMSCQEQNFLPVTLVSARICSWPLKF